MSSADRRRRTRVQGGWSASASSAKSSSQREAAHVAPAWTSKTVDNPEHKQRCYVYEEPETKSRFAPEVKLIEQPGVYDLSDSSNGTSRIRLFHNFYDAQESVQIFSELREEVPWKQRSDVRNGVEYLQPRLTSWFGDLGYSYSGLSHNPNPNWLPVLKKVKCRLEENTGLTFNSMLANLYRDGHDSVDWHSDNEPALGPNPTIASVSFGDIRNFELRKKPPPEEDGDYTYTEHVKVPLPAGSLLIMEGGTQDDWQHRIPKEYHDRNARINLTFRVILPT